jgi:hypothetical protein
VAAKPTAAAIFLAINHAIQAWACPFCNSTTGEQVRAGIFNGAFAANAGLVLLPFPFLLALVMWLFWSGDP